ncbi:unnamed protein product [Urochloa humidicola]
MEDEEVNISGEEEEADQHAAGGLGADEFDPRDNELVIHLLHLQLCVAVTAQWEHLARYSLREQGLFFHGDWAATAPPLPPQPHVARGACVDARCRRQPCQQQPSSSDLTEVAQGGG